MLKTILSKARRFSLGMTLATTALVAAPLLPQAHGAQSVRFTTDDHGDRPRSPLRCPRLAEGQHLLPLRQPAKHQTLQHGLPPGRPQAFAVDNAQAAQIPTLRPGKKISATLTRLIPVAPMQIKMVLNHPAATAQIPQHAACHTWPQPGSLVAALQMQIQQRRTVQRLFQRCGFVPLSLLWIGRRTRWLEMHPIVVERCRIFHRFQKQGARLGIEHKRLSRGRAPFHGVSENR